MSSSEDEINEMAPILNGLETNDQAEFTYHGVSDAIVCSDEIPNHQIADEMAFRYLLQYRTSIIVGDPIGYLSPMWNLARKSFPDWPGFSQARCQGSKELALKQANSQSVSGHFFGAAEGGPALLVA